MSEHPRTALWGRIAREQRLLLVPLVLLLAVNVIVYAGFIYPLSRRVSNVAERTQAAETELATARLAQVRASMALKGRSEASEEIDAFYRDVLPADQPAARRMMFRLQRLARETRVRASSIDSDVLEPTRDQTLSQMRIQMDLTGSYRAIREFIHRLEHTEDFLLLEELDLSDAQDAGTLTVRIALSTYFRRMTS